jgi:hypothetical protein
MVKLELQLQGHPRMAKEMTIHFPGKTTKHIRDKRKEVAYKKLLQSQSANISSPGSRNANSQRETLISQKPMETETTIPFPDTRGDNLQTPEKTGRTTPTALPSPGTEVPEDPILEDRYWILQTINQVMDGDSINYDMLGHFQQICSKLISTLNEIRASPECCSQDVLDSVYTELVALILDNAHNSRSEPKRKRSRNKNHPKRKKRYVYARTQELYKHNPSMLAKHIREGTNWLEDGAHEVLFEDIRTFYDDLWGHEADVIIPFQSTPPLENQPEGLEITAITSQEIKARITRLKTGTAPGPDGIAKRYLATPSERGPAAPIQYIVGKWQTTLHLEQKQDSPDP